MRAGRHYDYDYMRRAVAVVDVVVVGQRRDRSVLLLQAGGHNRQKQSLADSLNRD